MQHYSAEKLNRQFDPLKWPVIEAIEYGDNRIQLVMSVGDSLGYFAGHFPDQAVLPGVVQVHWAGCLTQKLFAVDAFYSIKALKFNNMILPNRQVQLNLLWSQECHNVRFNYAWNNEQFSSGTLNFNCSQGIGV